MPDTRTLFFILALGNLAFGLLVSRYIHASALHERHLRIWRLSTVCSGIGFLAGWLRPWLPEGVVPLAYAGNVLLIAGPCFALGGYCSFFRIAAWRRLVGALLAFSALTYGVLIGAQAGHHVRIMAGSLLAGGVYLAMAVVLAAHARHSRGGLVPVMALFDAIVGAALLLKVALGLGAAPYVPYAVSAINSAVYCAAFVALMSNGFGFLLLLKQSDDERLRQAHEELGVAEQRQRQFIAMISHEVRSPLAVIDTTTQLMELGAAPGSAAQAQVERIRRGARRLAQFFDNVLTQERLDTPHYRVAPGPVDIRELVLWSAELNEASAGAGQFGMQLPDDPVWLQGDEGLLKVLLNNLLYNAVKYSPPGAPIAVRLDDDAAGVRLSVSNTGAGIAPGDLPRIFDKYHRGAHSHAVPGLGLGLFLVRQIAELHGGRASMHSVPHGETRATVEWPRHAIASPP